MKETAKKRELNNFKYLQSRNVPPVGEKQKKFLKPRGRRFDVGKCKIR